MISDANVLIDLEEGKLLEQAFRLPYDITALTYCSMKNLKSVTAHYWTSVCNSWCWMALLYWKQIG